MFADAFRATQPGNHLTLSIAADEFFARQARVIDTQKTTARWRGRSADFLHRQAVRIAMCKIDGVEQRAD